MYWYVKMNKFAKNRGEPTIINDFTALSDFLHETKLKFRVRN